MRILGIETSCDETAAAVVEDGHNLLSNEVVSSVDLHAFYGGVVPEIAARSHVETIIPVIDRAVKNAGVNWDQIDAIAVTQGPGLLGSLLVGVLTARSLSLAKSVPLYAINHVEAHIYAAFITQKAPVKELKTYEISGPQPQFPVLALIVSGGHTQLVLFTDHFKYKVLGRTRDDAVGEAFDKVAKILGLPYPGGPSVSLAALSGNNKAVKLPNSKLTNPYEFSFSGLKTAALRAAQTFAGKDYTFPSHQLKEVLSTKQKNDLAASFQTAAINYLIKPLQLAVHEYQPKNIVIAGGVAANSELRKTLNKTFNIPVFYPDIKLCTDNAAMVASLGYFMASRKRPEADHFSLQAEPSLAM